MAVHKPSLYSNDPWNVGTTTISNGGIGTISASSIMNQKQHAIQGKMLTASLVISNMEYTSKPLDPMEIKKKLMEQLVEQMFVDKNIDFTKMQDASNWDHKFYARIYVVPDTQVRIIRENTVATTSPW